jgi:hypothetical protein
MEQGVHIKDWLESMMLFFLKIKKIFFFWSVRWWWWSRREGFIVLESRETQTEEHLGLEGGMGCFGIIGEVCSKRSLISSFSHRIVYEGNSDNGIGNEDCVAVHDSRMGFCDSNETFKKTNGGSGCVASWIGSLHLVVG